MIVSDGWSVNYLGIPPTVHRLFPGEHVKVTAQVRGHTGVIGIARVVAKCMVAYGEVEPWHGAEHW